MAAGARAAKKPVSEAATKPTSCWACWESLLVHCRQQPLQAAARFLRCCCGLHSATLCAHPACQLPKGPHPAWHHTERHFNHRAPRGPNTAYTSWTKRDQTLPTHAGPLLCCPINVSSARCRLNLVQKNPKRCSPSVAPSCCGQAASAYIEGF